MPVITAIEPQARRPERRSVFLDGEFALGAHLEVVVRAGLRVGQEVTLAELQTLARAEETRSARDAALVSLGARERSGKEIERLLLRKGFEAEVAAAVVEQLRERGLVDDQRFSRAWVASRTGKRPLGPARLAAELRARGVDREAIGEALAGIDPESEYALALRAARQRSGGEPLADPDARRRLGMALRRRGFSWETIERVCASLARESENGEE